ncbi:GFA family protein [Salinisphaera sp. Q1T1-3]|uniref:GFA family protein n=1 Tax=Salinisphaera sp. Q1T1-3 TaxID=2321229 RepID=UPI00131442A0|nr:GFA family protein [Salinisphaera sp. Q1T1-3]
MSETYELSCDCGHVTMTATGTPKVSLYCHCGSCRSLYSVDVLSATGWDDNDVQLPDEARLFVHTMTDKDMTRYGCPQCGMIMYGRHAPGIPVIPHGVFRKANGGKLPAALAPSLHLFYRERVLDVDDDLEKSMGGEALGM